MAAYLPEGFDASTPAAHTRAAHARIALCAQGSSVDAPLQLDPGAADAAGGGEPQVRTVPQHRRKRRWPAGEEEEEEEGSSSSSSSSVASEQHEVIDLCESEEEGQGVTDGAEVDGWAAVLPAMMTLGGVGMRSSWQGGGKMTSTPGSSLGNRRGMWWSRRSRTGNTRMHLPPGRHVPSVMHGGHWTCDCGSALVFVYIICL